MNYVTLGGTGITVSRLGLGGLFVASFATALDQARSAVNTALDLGINYIDTAPTYGDSEEVLGVALEREARPLIMSTKLGGRPQPFLPRDRDTLLQSFEESLRALRRESIDIVMVHEPDRPGQYDWWTDWLDVNGPVLELLQDLKRQGCIKAIGVGGTTTSEMAHLCRSGKFDVVLTALNYSLLWREAALEVIPAAKEKNMGIIVGSPLHQGALATRFDSISDDPRAYWVSQSRKAQFRELYAFVDECGIPLPELSLRFVLSNPDIHCVLMGAKSAAEVRTNVEAVSKGPLPDEILKRLDEIAAMVPFRPFNEPFGIGWILSNPAAYRGPGEA